MNRTLTKCEPTVAQISANRFLSARDNPLNVERVNSIPFRFGSHDWEYQLDQLHRLNFRAAIVGRQGSGKSTLLSELFQQLNNIEHPTHYVFLPQRPFDYKSMIENALKESAGRKTLLVDGMERLGIFQRRRLFRQTRKSGLVVTSHQTCSLPTWIQCQTTPELMAAVLGDLGQTQPEVLISGQRCFNEANGNIRDALRELYDQFASGRFNNILS